MIIKFPFANNSVLPCLSLLLKMFPTLYASIIVQINLDLPIPFVLFCRNDLVKYLKDFREQRNNSLSGLTVDDIIAGVSQMIEGSNNSSIDKVCILYTIVCMYL